MKDVPAELVDALGDVPVFPLPQAVLFPGALLPLHIFEPRYRAMLAHCLATHRAMVVTRLVEKEGSGAEPPRFALVGGLGVIVHHQALPDGRSNIVLQGKARVALSERPSADPFRRVRATVLEDVPTHVLDADRTALLAAATRFAASLRETTEVEVTFPAGLAPEALADLCAQHLLFDPDARQAVLEERDVAARVLRVATELALQQRALDVRSRSELN
jgi:ATP-dependent Lon protease